MALDVVQCKVGIAAGERRALAEIGERIGADEIIASEHAFDAFANDLRGEQFGERGGNRLEQRSLAHKMDIGVNRKARCRQQARERDDVIAVEPEGSGKRKPARDPAAVCGLTVMVDEPAAPLAPQRRVVATRDQACVLHRDLRLVIVAVERPGLDLALAAFAAVQQRMEWMQAMVSPLPYVAQRQFEIIGRHQLALHSTISIPSSATSQPLPSTCRRSGEPSIRIGLVLLMCTKMRRAAMDSSAASDPPSPSIGMCPMQRPVLVPAPARIISSSTKSVPSKKTTLARARCSLIAVVTVAAPGMYAMRAAPAKISTPTFAAVSLAVSGSSPSR